MTTATTLQLELLDPRCFHHHPLNRPGGLKQSNIDELVRNIRENGYRPSRPVTYCIPDEAWPKEYHYLIGLPVLLAGHHRNEAAIVVDLPTVPAVREDMTYELTLKFLDDDNTDSALHWFEKGIIHESRREFLRLPSSTYAEKELGSKHLAQRLNTVRKLLDAGIKTADLEGIGEVAAQMVSTKAPYSEWRELFDEIRAGRLSTTTVKLYQSLKSRYDPIDPSAAAPNETSYLYIATSPHTELVKCGMTTGDDPVKYVASKANSTWSLDFSCYFSVEIPTVHVQAADALMRDKLGSGWPAFREFYTVKPNTAKRILLEIAAKYADDDDED